MGHQLHIVRRDGRPITAAEWLAVIQDDDDLTLDPFATDHFANWNTAGSARNSCCFFWDDDRVLAVYADRETLGKMIEIAGRLGAVVCGDDGKIYSSMDDYTADVTVSRPWWRFW